MGVRSVTLPVKLGIAAALIYNSWPLGLILNPKAARYGLASDLGAIGQPYNWFFIGGDIVCGLLCLIIIWQCMLPLSRMNFRVIVASNGLGIFGVMTAVSAALPLNCSDNFKSCGYNPGQPLGVHDVTGAIAAFGIFLGLAAMRGTTHGSRTLQRWNAWILGTWTLWGVLFALTPLRSVQQLPNIQFIAIVWQQIFLLLSGIGVVLIVYGLDNITKPKDVHE